MARVILLLALISAPACAMLTRKEAPLDVYALREQVLSSKVVKDKILKTCSGQKKQVDDCESRVGDTLFCQLLGRKDPALEAKHCGGGAKAAPAAKPAVQAETAPAAAPPKVSASFAALKAKITASKTFVDSANGLATTMGCDMVKNSKNCANYVHEAAFCLAFATDIHMFKGIQGTKEEAHYCSTIDEQMPVLSLAQSPTFLQIASKKKAPEDELAKEMTHDLEMNFNKIAPFGKEDTAKELQDHAAKTQDTLVDAVENAEVAEIKRAVFRALTRLRAATIKEFDTIARLETQAIDAYNDAHHYRAENPLAHLHEDEAPVETDKLKSFH